MTGIRLVPLVHRADASIGHAEARSEVPGAEVECSEALGGAGYPVYVGETSGALYLGFEHYLAGFEVCRELELEEEGCGDVEVFGTPGFGDEDAIQQIAGLFDYLDEVA